MPAVGPRLRRRRGHDPVLGPVRVLLDGAPVLSEHDAPAEPPVQRRAVHDDGVLDVVARVGHNRDGGVLTGAEAIVPDELDRLGLHDGFLRIHQQIHQGVHAVQLVERDVSHRLLPHRALIRVPRRLVVVRVRDDTRAHAQQSERLDLQVRRLRRDLALVQRDVRVVLLVDVQVLDEPLRQKVVKRPPPRLERVQVNLLHQ